MPNFEDYKHFVITAACLTEIEWKQKHRIEWKQKHGNGGPFRDYNEHELADRVSKHTDALIERCGSRILQNAERRKLLNELREEDTQKASSAPVHRTREQRRKLREQEHKRWVA
jgi:hypothetical protein